MFDEAVFSRYGIRYIFLLDSEDQPHTITDEPSAINCYSAQWHHHGRLHRTNGPALVRSDKFLHSHNYCPKYEYFLNGTKIEGIESPEEFQRYVELLAFI